MKELRLNPEKVLAVKNYLQVNACGLDTRKTREEICSVCGIKDRVLRFIDGHLRKVLGIPVVATSKHSGYWIFSRHTGTAGDRAEAELMVKETYARIRELRDMVRPVEKELYPEGQLQLL